MRAPFSQLRQRAYELADTGQFESWLAVAAHMEAEGYDKASSRLRADPILLRLLDARCKQARET
ncbi:MAG TPA: hypothetical protein VG841_14785 [Caulobacterales bacterium]|nr:hypothetical protein [Caulobacterales bacterium]